jgi:hypothetical protein
MRSRTLKVGLVAACSLAAATLGLTGCASNKLVGNLVPNLRPSVELTNAPSTADRSNPYFYAYKINWSGNDPDGRVTHYLITARRLPDGRLIGVDPPSAAGADTTWLETEKNEETVFFQAAAPDTIRGNQQPTASDPHTFVIKAVDDDGAVSEPRWRSFYSFTIAPSVAIRNPVPSPFLRAQVTPSVRIEWDGSDPDGQFTQKPVLYKYTMLDLDVQANIDLLANPDSLRRKEAATNWAGWLSTPADTQFVQFTNLTPGKSYLFVLIGFDEAGAYSPVFTLNSNMLQLTAGYAASNGPRIRFFNQYIDYTYESGGYSPDPLREVPIEVPSGIPLRVGWEALPSPGSRIQYFRWMVDGNINDETARVDEDNDYQYWSRPDPTMPNEVTLRGFQDGDHFFYLECGDNNGQKSLGILKVTAVTPSFDRTLGVVNDTRLEVDKFPDRFNPTIPGTYTKPWPAKTELDTFLFARGGFPWRGTKNPTSGVISTPGVLAGYPIDLRPAPIGDTLGTRLGLENPARGALLSNIGKFRHLIWMVDDVGAQYIESIDQTIFPITALYAMSGPGRASTLAAYVQLGGKVWMMGGGAAFASLRRFDKGNNNQGQTTVFSSSAAFNELGPGRIMFDGAHWRSSMAVTKSAIRTLRVDQPITVQWDNGTRHDTSLVNLASFNWRHENPAQFQKFGAPTILSAPNYSKLPSEMRPHSAIPDPLPPTRLSNQSGLFYITSYPCEYILEPNFMVENLLDYTAAGGPVKRDISVIDEIYEAESIVLLRSPVRYQVSPQRAPQMTYYHGGEANQVVFTGFAPWNYARQDCIALVDFVLQDIWGLSRDNIDRGSFAPAFQRSGTRPARRAAPIQRNINASVSPGTPRE